LDPNNVEAQISVTVNFDPYNTGKIMSKFVRAATIAEALFPQDLATEIAAAAASIQKYTAVWLARQNNPDYAFEYESIWGGITVPTTAPGNQYADYGFFFYNDHHFHFGYYLYTIAYCIYKDASWGTQNKEAILWLARDIGNPSPQDTFFPIARHKDWFAGNSWATGVIPNAPKVQQESSSEAINCYYGLYLVGKYLGIQSMQDTGRILLATEMHSTAAYYQMTQASQMFFPPALRKVGSVAILFDDSYQYTNDFPCMPNCYPGKHSCCKAINALPFTEMSREVVSKGWIQVQSKLLLSTLVDYTPSDDTPGDTPLCPWCCGTPPVNSCPPPGTAQTNCTCCKGPIPAASRIWQGFVHMMLSVLGGSYKDNAWTFAQSMTPPDFDDGNSKSNVMFWIATQH